MDEKETTVNGRKGVSLVTGASSGLGLEMAHLLAGRGFDLVLIARNTKKLEELANLLSSKHGVAIRSYSVDLSEPGSAQRVFDFTREKGIEIEVLINNAGVGLYGEHASLDRDKLDKMMQLNVISLCDLCHLFGGKMKQHGKGWILNVASTAAYQPTPFFAAYGASKSFVLNFSEALAKEMEDYGVIVSCLSPGPSDTGFFSEFDERGIQNRHFSKADRANPRMVAEVGINILFQGKLSKIVGTMNYLRALSGRFASRAMVADVSKRLLKPTN